MAASSGDLNHNTEMGGNKSGKMLRPDKGCSRFYFPGFGMLCAFLSAAFLAINALFVKMISLGPVQQGLFRVYTQFFILLPLLFYKRRTVDVLGPKGLRKFLWMRGFAGSSAMVFLYLALSELPAGNAVTITYLSMIIVPFIARIFLREKLTIFDLIFAVVSLLGVVLIAKPTFIFTPPSGQAPTSILGVLYGVLAAFCQAISITTIRKLGQHTYAPLNVLYHSVCGSIITTILCPTLEGFRMPCLQELPYLFLLGVTGVLVSVSLTLALRTERAGTVGVLRSVQIIMVYVLQITVLGDVPSMLDLIGAALVFSSSIGIGVRKIINEKRRRDSIKK